MSLSDFDGLKASVAAFLMRSDLTAVIPDFITMAEAQFSRRLIADGPVRQMMGRSDATVNDEYYTLPTDFMGIRSVYIYGLNGYKQIAFAEPEKLAERKMACPAASGDPQLFSIVGDELQFWPWASGGSYSVEITYWKRPEALSDIVGSNWVLEQHPDIYLYTTLIQSAPYLRDDPRLETWGTLASTAISDLVKADKVSRYAPQMAVSPLIHGAP